MNFAPNGVKGVVNMSQIRRCIDSSSFGQPRETKPTLGVDFAVVVVVVDMSNLGIALDQLYAGKYDECCAG